MDLSKLPQKFYNKNFISLLACPICKFELALKKGVLKCLTNQDHHFSQSDGVFNFVIEVGDKDSIKRWKKNLGNLYVMRKQIESESDANSKFVKDFSDTDRELSSNFLVSYLKKNKINTIIELGCGIGSMQQFFDKENYIGLDPCITVRVEQLNFPFVRGSSEALPFMGGEWTWYFVKIL